MARSLLCCVATVTLDWSPHLNYGRGFFMIKEFLRDEEGQSVVEYSLLLTLIGASMVFVVTLLGYSISQTVGLSDITVERYTEWAYERFKSR
jgi:Flp pilus assembly pilin Flp